MIYGSDSDETVVFDRDLNVKQCLVTKNDTMLSDKD